MSPFSSKNISAEHLIDYFSEGILVLDDSYKILFASNVFYKLSGYSATDVIDKPIDIIFPANAEGVKFVIENAQRKSTDKLHTEIITRENKKIPVRLSLMKDEGKPGEQQYFVFIKDGSSYQRIRKDILRKAVVIEKLSKSRKIREGKLTEAIYEILQMASRAVNTARVNAWLFNEDHSQIECIGNYDTSVNQMVRLDNLTRINSPKYFKLFETEMIIATSDAFHDPVTRELLNSYLKPNDIHSLMDIPVRIEGEIIGVLCFEHRETMRVWNLQEQKFGLVMAQMISLALESCSKQKARYELEGAVNEQRVLLQEVHHRVKNNLAIISSLLNLQANKAKDDYHKNLFQDSKNRLDAIANVHQLLYLSKSYSKIDFKEYLEKILNNLHDSFSASGKEIIIEKNIEPIELDVSVSIPLALIANELITNSYKHAFNTSKQGKLFISLKEKNKRITFEIGDSGPGYNPEQASESSIGIDIINGLVKQIDAEMNYNGTAGSLHTISFMKP